MIMAEITLPESSLFLLLRSANIDAELTNGELTEDEEKLILRCVNKWGFYDDFYTQDQLVSAIKKYQDVYKDSYNDEDFITQCAEILINKPPIRDITYYLCNEIIFLPGRPQRDSKEEYFLNQLERILKVDPAISTFLFGLEVFKRILYIENDDNGNPEE
jgi:hypothetical protein